MLLLRLKQSQPPPGVDKITTTEEAVVVASSGPREYSGRRHRVFTLESSKRTPLVPHVSPRSGRSCRGDQPATALASLRQERRGVGPTRLAAPAWKGARTDTRGARSGGFLVVHGNSTCHVEGMGFPPSSMTTLLLPRRWKRTVSACTWMALQGPC